MKVNIIRDENGKVFATFENGVPGGPQLKPMLRKGHTVQEVEAPDNYRANVKAFYKQHSK